MGFKDKVYQRRVLVDQCGELVDRTVHINRVAKVVKGGRRFSFSAWVVTGDGQGHVGFGLGKANEVPDAIRKASESARSNIIRIPIRGLTIPHDVLASYGSSSVVMKSAPPGTGVIAGSVVRAIMESAGVHDIRTKCLGSSNPGHMLHATFAGLLALREPEEVAQVRGKVLEETGYVAQ